MAVVLYVLYFCLGMIMYTIGYFVGRANGKAETPKIQVEPKLLSTPAKTVSLKASISITRGDVMESLHESKTVPSYYINQIAEQLALRARAYIKIDYVDALSDGFSDCSEVTGTLVVYDINEEKM